MMNAVFNLAPRLHFLLFPLGDGRKRNRPGNEAGLFVGALVPFVNGRGHFLLQRKKIAIQG